MAVTPSGAVSSLGQSPGHDVTIRRAMTLDHPRSEMAQATGSNRPNVTDEFTPDDWDRIIDRVVEKVEEKVLSEQNRRGRVFDSNIF